MGSILILHLIVELVKSLVNSNVTNEILQDLKQGFGSLNLLRTACGQKLNQHVLSFIILYMSHFEMKSFVSLKNDITFPELILKWNV